jgi:uncharacterized protein (DUF1800 family)
LRLLTTSRPAVEKATLFWLDHFAISAGKVENGPMMVDYVDVVRANCLGKFPDLLVAVSQTPAMLHWLDGSGSIKGNPNENFAREVLELYTLGIGHYSEADVQELSRACTGWSLRYPQYENGVREERAFIMECLAQGRAFVAASFAPALFDEGTKTIVGKKGAFTMESALRDLAMRPQTARHLARKMLMWYAFSDPTDKEVESVARAYLSSGGSLTACLRAIVALPDFWSDERCANKLIKSPVEYLVGFARGIGLGHEMVKYGKQLRKKEEAMPDEVTGPLYWAAFLLERMDMIPFFPPDVAGWNWGQAWINSNTIVFRQKVREFLIYANAAEKRFCIPYAEALRGSGITDDFALASRMATDLDLTLTREQLDVVVQELRRAGGARALASLDATLYALDLGWRVMLATPEANLH